MASSNKNRVTKMIQGSGRSNYPNLQRGKTVEFSFRTPPTPKAPALTVTDEELSKYFSNADSIPTVSSPISNHLERVKATMVGEFPTYMSKVKTLRTSSFKLASSLDIPLPVREIFNKVALQINDLAYKYRLSKESYDDASFDLKKPRELQEKKAQFHASYVDIEKEKRSSLTRQKEIEDRTTVLNTRMEEIIQQLTSKLTKFSDQRVNLYAKATSLDRDIILLLSQKVGLERDLKNGSEGIAEVNKSWDSLVKMLAEVRLDID